MPPDELTQGLIVKEMMTSFAASLDLAQKAAGIKKIISSVKTERGISSLSDQRVQQVIANVLNYIAE